jgi:hypothetical protein
MPILSKQGRLPRAGPVDHHVFPLRIRGQPGNCRIEIRRAAEATREIGSRCVVTLADIRGLRSSRFRVASSALAGDYGATGSLPTRVRNIVNPYPIKDAIAVDDAIIKRRISSES